MKCTNSVSNQLVSKRDKLVNFKNVGDSNEEVFYNIQSGNDVDIIINDMPFSKEVVITKINAISWKEKTGEGVRFWR